MKKTQDLTKGNPFSTILTYAIPVIGGNLFQLFYTLADSVIVGQTLGADALAAVGATATVIYLVQQHCRLHPAWHPVLRGADHPLLLPGPPHPPAAEHAGRHLRHGL